MSYMKKDEDAEASLLKLDRTSVFQEGVYITSRIAPGLAGEGWRDACYTPAPRLFNTSPISPRKCRALLTKLAVLMFTGERFPTEEATTLFFSVSKLFQNKDPSLRQVVYLALKELSGTAEDVIMSTSIIMKDTAVASDVIYRPNAIRALCRIIDASTVQAIERSIKTAIVDKNPSVSSAALVSSYHLLPVARDVVRRWQSETQEAASSGRQSTGFFGFGGASHGITQTNYMPQYHAIGLLYQMRAHDRMALVKMVQQYGNGAVKSPAALVMLVRLALKLAVEDPSLRAPMGEKLLHFMQHKHEMVVFEAAKAVCNFPGVSDAAARTAVQTLQIYLSSPRNVTKFAAIRILHQFAAIKPGIVNMCNQDIETLIGSSNRSIATFAITTLLKTGNEASVDRLMTQISGFMADITDEFKITIVEAIRTLCLKFPSKQAGMLTFLSGILRDEGGYEFKRSVVESMFDLIKFVPQSKDEALSHLAEFIEDCEFTKLAVRILHLLGVEGPQTAHPTKYIRYIYNRVVLENAIVRAAAVTALAKFGVCQKDPEVKKSVRVLLTRCLDDVDDEVRDRAALNLRLMKEEDDELAGKFVRHDSMFSLPTFEHQLVMYVTANDKAAFAKAFDISAIPVVSHEQALAEERTKKLTSATPTLKAPSTGGAAAAKAGGAHAAEPAAAGGVGGAAAATAGATQRYAEQLAQIPELRAYGALLKSSAPVALTESETEYVVSAVKHIFKEHVVLQFDVRNTLPDTVLEDVTVVAVPEDEEALEEDFIVPAPKLTADEPGTVYVAFKKAAAAAAANTPFTVTSFTNILKFTSKEIDPSTGEPEAEGYEDEYQVEDLELGGSDYVVPAFAGSFDHVWEGTAAAGHEATETLQLENAKSLPDATESLVAALSLQPLEGSDVVVSNTTHAVKLYGKTVSGGKVAALVRLAYSAKSGVTTKVIVRSEEEGVAELVIASVA
ncbi:coatomer subunit gamma [Ascosphaera acerosa]|nr:coatomer subunit gamma [Ascosphaera acerosa]